MVGYIYKYYNPITNKYYIGQTTDLVNRKSSHRGKAEYVKNKFYNAVRKYGWKIFEFSIIAEIDTTSVDLCTLMLDRLEVLYIQIYDSYHNGYNSTPGGHAARGMKRSEDYKNYCKNRTYSKATRFKMSEAAKHKVVSQSTKEKYRANAIARNFSKYREITTEKRNAAIRKSKGKPVIQLDTNNNIIDEFGTLRDAVLFIKSELAPNLTINGIEKSLIRHCRGEIKKSNYYGFVWKYKTNV